MELTVTTMMSLDGVTQSPGAPEEDPSGGFELGGWAMPYFEEESSRHIDAIFGRADAFLLGRKTYEIFASYWPGVGDENPISTALNAKPKHVVSSTLGDLSWDGASWHISKRLYERIGEHNAAHSEPVVFGMEGP